MSILPKVIYKFSAIPLKIPIAFFIEREEKNSKMSSTIQKSLNTEEDEQPGGIILSDYKLYYLLPSYGNKKNMVVE